MGWSSDETRLFVKLYLDHKCLWNIEDENYKHKQKRSEAIRDISSKFFALSNIKLNEPEVKTKIKSLRSTYCQYLQKMKLKRRSLDYLQTSLSWFKDIHKCFSSFNIPRYMYEEGISYDQQETETDLDDSSQKVWVPDALEDEESSDNPKNPFISPTDDDYILLLKNEPIEEAEPPKHYKRKRKYKWRNRDSCETTEHVIGSTVKRTTSQEDEFDIYGKYIASQLREMGLQRALRVQLQIQNIVSEARLDSLSD